MEINPVIFFSGTWFRWPSILADGWQWCFWASLRELDRMVSFVFENKFFFQKRVAEFSRPRIWLPMLGRECDMQGWGSRVYSAHGVVQEAILSSYHKFGSNGGNNLRFFEIFFKILFPKTIIVHKLNHPVKLIHPVKTIIL